MIDSNANIATIARPTFALYVVWHPSNPMGSEIADLLRRNFSGDRYRNVAGGGGLSVIYRMAASPDGAAPLPIMWDDAETTAIVVLADSALTGDPAWRDYVRDLARTARERGLPASLFPVAMDDDWMRLELEQQALRWETWNGTFAERSQRLVRDLTLEFCLILRHRLGSIRRPGSEAPSLANYLEKIQVFISHSKHDDDGMAISKSIRDWLQRNSRLSTFFDVDDMPAGMPFSDVLLHQVQNSVVVTLHTDSYSSREWCRREVIVAKRRRVPMVVVDCLRCGDERAMPYMGNVPVVRMSPDRSDRLGVVAGSLLAEVFRDYIWRCRVAPLDDDYPNALFTSRPPELISLAELVGSQTEDELQIVYPEPILGTDEAQLFLEIAPNVRVQTLTEWLEEVR